VYNCVLYIHLDITYLSLLAFDSSHSLHIYTPPLFQMELEKDSWEYIGEHALTSGCPERWLSNHKLKSVLNCTVWSQCTPVPEGQMDRQTYIHTDGQTDEHHGNSATIRFMNALRAKNSTLSPEGIISSIYHSRWRRVSLPTLSTSRRKAIPSRSALVYAACRNYKKFYI